MTPMYGPALLERALVRCAPCCVDAAYALGGNCGFMDARGVEDIVLMRVCLAEGCALRGATRAMPTSRSPDHVCAPHYAQKHYA